MAENQSNILLYTQQENSKNCTTWSFSLRLSLLSVFGYYVSIVGNFQTLYCFSFRVIDGLETLDELEKLPVNEKTYRPLNDVHIKDITIHANPFAQ